MHTELFLFTELFCKCLAVNVFPSVLGVIGRLVLDYRSQSSNATDDIRCSTSISTTSRSSLKP